LTGIGIVERRLLAQAKYSPLCAALIDPEDFSAEEAGKAAVKAAENGVSVILVGGSTLASQSRLDDVVRSIKRHVSLPVILFPGNVTGVSRFADAILFSSLLNSTNPYFIIGAQALGSMEVYNSKIETIPMGYLVFGNSSATSFVGQVNSLPAGKPNLAVIYALAARYLGMRSLYLEAGSGSGDPVPSETIRLVRRFYDGFLIVGGGITNDQTARQISKAGADMLVIGNLLQSHGFEGTLRKITIAIKRR
jgi:phosphoglycerol geranylgeranyltransferase